MADWLTGISEVPDEPPMGFAMPDAPELIISSDAPNVTKETPLEAPVFEEPDKPAPQLEHIEPMTADPRDPSEPFNGSAAPGESEFDPTQPLVAISSAELMTHGSAWGSASNRHTPLAGTIVGGRYLPPPTGQPVVATGLPSGIPTQAAGQASPTAGYPPASTPAGYPPSPAGYPQASVQGAYPPATGGYSPNAVGYPTTPMGNPGSPAVGYPPVTGHTPTGQPMQGSSAYPPVPIQPGYNQGNPYAPTPPPQGLAGPVPTSGPLNMGQAIRVVGFRVYAGVVLGILFPQWAVWALIFSWLSSSQIPRFGAKLNQLIAGVVFIRFLLVMLGMFSSSLPYGFTTTFSLVMCWVLLFGMPAYVYHLAKTGKA